MINLLNKAIFLDSMTKPLCQYFGQCGGCSWQHIKYDVQLENKKKALENAINFYEIRVFSGKEYWYRNRMDMIFHAGGIGFRKRGEWQKIVDIDKCVISNDRLNELISEVRGFFSKADYFDIKKRSGTFCYTVIRTPNEGSCISFVLNEDSARLKEAIERIKEFSVKTTADNIIVTYVHPNTNLSVSDNFFVVKGKDMLKEKYLGKEFLYSVQGFFQNNHEMAEKMQEYCNGLLKSYNTREAHLFDLYGGVGTFAIINSGLFRGVTIVESDRRSTDAAKENIKINKINNTEAVLLDSKYLKRLAFPENLFVITDPPRSGMHQKTIEQLKKLRPKVIIYISCNVQQLGRDLEKFKDYKIKSSALFDLFPQTTHIEAIVELILQ